MTVTELFALALAAIAAENFVLARVLGIPPFLGSGRQPGAVLGMGLAVTAAVGLGSVLAWGADALLLAPLGLEALRPAACLLLTAGLAYGAGLPARKYLPEGWAGLSVYLPLAGANGAVLGAALWSTGAELTLGAAACGGLLAGLWFFAALVLLSCVWERLEFSQPPESFAGLPLALVAAGLLAMAFWGFSGVRVW